MLIYGLYLQLPCSIFLKWRPNFLLCVSDNWYLFYNCDSVQITLAYKLATVTEIISQKRCRVVMTLLQPSYCRKWHGLSGSTVSDDIERPPIASHIRCSCPFNLQHTHTRLTALFPGLPGWAGTRKVKPIWILLEQETVSGSGICWAICKSAPRSRQITTPVPHHSVFYRPDALPAAQPTASKHWKHNCSSSEDFNRTITWFPSPYTVVQHARTAAGA